MCTCPIYNSMSVPISVQMVTLLKNAYMCIYVPSKKVRLVLKIGTLFLTEKVIIK